jgi:hypothetical protein
VLLLLLQLLRLLLPPAVGSALVAPLPFSTSGSSPHPDPSSPLPNFSPLILGTAPCTTAADGIRLGQETGTRDWDKRLGQDRVKTVVLEEACNLSQNGSRSADFYFPMRFWMRDRLRGGLLPLAPIAPSLSSLLPPLSRIIHVSPSSSSRSPPPIAPLVPSLPSLPSSLRSPRRPHASLPSIPRPLAPLLPSSPRSPRSHRSPRSPRSPRPLAPLAVLPLATCVILPNSSAVSLRDNSCARQRTDSHRHPPKPHSPSENKPQPPSPPTSAYRWQRAKHCLHALRG